LSDQNNGYDHFRIRSLMEHLPPLETVNPDTPLRFALAKMYAKNYSQLAVVENGKCVGSIDLNSIYIRLKKAGEEQKLGLEFMDLPVKVFMNKKLRYVDPDDDILKHIEWIAENGFAFVGTSSEIIAVVTNYDLVHFFKAKTEPFLLLREIETCLRYVVGQKLQDRELEQALTSIASIKGDLQPSRLDELSLDDLRQLILANWSKLHDSLTNRERTDSQLRAIRDFRNQILNFRISLSDDQLSELKDLRDHFIRVADDVHASSIVSTKTSFAIPTCEKTVGSDSRIARGLIGTGVDSTKTKGLEGVYESNKNIPREASEILKIMSLIENKLRKVIKGKPRRESEINDALENLFIGAGLENDFTREKERIIYSTKTYVPDFVFKRIDAIVETKFCDKKGKEMEIISQINDDIVAYKTRYPNLIFIVYDIGIIRNIDQFKTSIENQESIVIKVIKH